MAAFALSSLNMSLEEFIAASDFFSSYDSDLDRGLQEKPIQNPQETAETLDDSFFNTESDDNTQNNRED